MRLRVRLACALPALSFQLVRMDMESLPTGIQIPKAGQVHADCLDGIVKVGVFSGFASGNHPVCRELNIADFSDV